LSIVIGADVFAHELGGVVDALGLGRQILGHRLPGGRAIFAGDGAVDALRAGEHDALDIESARRLQHVDEPQHVDLDAERRIGSRNRTDERRRVHHMGDVVFFDRLEKTRHVQNVALLEVDLIDDVGDEAVVAMPRKHDGPVPLVDELAAGLGTDDAHSAGDENLHCRLIRSWHRPR
jgi:hypothetical protein